jgi:hypothetical protein
MTFSSAAAMLTALLLASSLLIAQAQPPPRGYAAVPDPPPGRTRTEIILITPAPTMTGQTIILTPRPHGGRGVTVCSEVVAVGGMCTGPGK